MRPNRGHLALGILCCVVLGTMFGLANKEQIGFTPLRVGTPQQNSRSESTSTETAATENPATEIPPIGNGNSTSERRTNAIESSTSQGLNDPRLGRKKLVPLASGREAASLSGMPAASALQAEADAAIREARYEHAAGLLQELVRAQGERPDSRLLYKLALCRETLGDDYAALEQYQKSINRTHQQPLQSASRLGQSRIWLTNEKALAARDDLYKMLLSHRLVRSHSAEGRLLHQLALSAAKVAILEKVHLEQQLIDSFIHLPDEEITVESLIEDLALTSPFQWTNETDSVPVLQMLKLDDSAESILFEVESETISAINLLEQLTTRAELSISLEQDCQQELEHHVLIAAFRGVPFSILLDAILIPMNMAWRQQGKEIFVKRRSLADELKEADAENMSLQASERLLKYAIATAPDHALAPLSQLSFAALKQRAGETQTALRAYERTLERYPRLPGLSQIWLNIGKCRLSLERTDAVEAFQMAADLGIGGDETAIAHAYQGRIHLRNDEARRALSEFQFADNFVRTPELRREIQFLKAAALLLEGKREPTRDVLREIVGELNSGAGHHELAVLVGLLKNLESSEETQRERDAVTLLNAISQIDEHQKFGEHWYYLKARSYYEIGFHEEAVRLYFQFHSRFPTLPLEQRFRELIFNHNSKMLPIDKQNPPPLDHLPVPERDLSLSIEFILNQSKIEPGEEDSVIRMCRQILKRESLKQQERHLTLHFLGNLYQRRGEHQLAIQCFTDSLDHTSEDLILTSPLPQP